MRRRERDLVEGRRFADRGRLDREAELVAGGWDPIEDARQISPVVTVRHLTKRGRTVRRVMDRSPKNADSTVMSDA